jgi:hypothetical protein
MATQVRCFKATLIGAALHPCSTLDGTPWLMLEIPNKFPEHNDLGLQGGIIAFAQYTC